MNRHPSTKKNRYLAAVAAKVLFSRLKNWQADFDLTYADSMTRHLRDLCKKLRGSLALIPATDAVAA